MEDDNWVKDGCPYCGREVVREEVSDDEVSDDEDSYVVIICQNCGEFIEI